MQHRSGRARSVHVHLLHLVALHQLRQPSPPPTRCLACGRQPRAAAARRRDSRRPGPRSSNDPASYRTPAPPDPASAHHPRPDRPQAHPTSPTGSPGRRNHPSAANHPPPAVPPRTRERPAPAPPLSGSPALIRIPNAGFVAAHDFGSDAVPSSTWSGVSAPSDHSKYASRSTSPRNARSRTRANAIPSSMIV